jgi:hypothetical protein
MNSQKETFVGESRIREHQILDYYIHPAMMTSGGEYASMFDGLPRDLAALVHIVQGLLLHEHFAPAYGVTLSSERRQESHIRSIEKMLARLLTHNSQPLTTARTLDTRLVGVCRHFSLLLAAMLRAKGVPARARCGFGAYFNAGRFEDHWVCEYWQASESRWVLVDAQIDEVQQSILKPDFNLLDVPRDCFIVAGDAWARCRRGNADPSAFGIFNMRGLWFIAGNVIRDVAALNNMEMLPWDVWGMMPHADEPIQDEPLTFFDQLAALTHTPDTSFEELRVLYEDDDRLCVPTTVFNALLNRQEVT